MFYDNWRQAYRNGKYEMTRCVWVFNVKLNFLCCPMFLFFLSFFFFNQWIVDFHYFRISDTIFVTRSVVTIFEISFLFLPYLDTWYIIEFNFVCFMFSNFIKLRKSEIIRSYNKKNTTTTKIRSIL